MSKKKQVGMSIAVIMIGIMLVWGLKKVIALQNDWPAAVNSLKFGDTVIVVFDDNHAGWGKVIKVNRTYLVIKEDDGTTDYVRKDQIIRFKKEVN